MKDKLLLITGILLVFLGAIGLIGVGSAYFFLKPNLDNSVISLGNIVSAFYETINNAEAVADEGVVMLQKAAELGDISPELKPLADMADSIRSITSSVEKLKTNLQFHQDQLESARNLALGWLGQLRLAFNITFVWLIIQQVAFLALGLCLLSVRRSLAKSVEHQKYEKINKDEETSS
ncbi:MAG: hypothetical protein QXI32_04830 [Candidatus Bathyarchaeia archaeon]